MWEEKLVSKGGPIFVQYAGLSKGHDMHAFFSCRTSQKLSSTIKKKNV